jgi:hypothetical protein
VNALNPSSIEIIGIQLLPLAPCCIFYHNPNVLDSCKTLREIEKYTQCLKITEKDFEWWKKSRNDL